MATIRGTDDADQLYGTGADLIRGYGGNDHIVGSDFGSALYGDAGDDTISGGRSSDALFGGTGNDYLWGNDGKDELYGGSGNDTLAESAGRDLLDGGAGIDTVSLSYFSYVPGAHEAVIYNFGSANGALKTPDGNTLVSIEQIHVIGSNYDDIFKGGARNDFISGWTGNDKLYGQDGDDTLLGGNGTDILQGGAGNDTLNGGGHDDQLFGGDGDDTLIGGSNSDVYTGSDVMEGGLGADHFVSGPGRTDLIYSHSKQGVYVDLQLHIGFGGDAQGDTFEGGFGTITGSKYADRLAGGGTQMGQGGDDQLVANYDTDLMTGGAGRDTFIFRYSPDYIADLAHVTDFDQAVHEKLDVSGIDAGPKLGDQAFTFIGTDAFSGKAGELRYEFDDSGHTIVQMNVTKDTLSDLTFVLDGAFTLTAADFLL